MADALSPAVRTALRDSDTRIVLTGAGGWLGLATLELLAEALGPTLPARVRCFGSAGRTLTLLSGATIGQQPLRTLPELEPAPTLVLHTAFLTKDRAENMPEQEYRNANRALSQIVLDALDGIGTEGVFVASSGAARFADDPAKSAAMRLYGALKRADEEAFAEWAERGGKRAAIARIFNIAGPHINKHQSYALSAFILDALARRPITVRAPHRVLRGYVAISELMSLAFALLLDAHAGVACFDTGGRAMELEQVAGTVAATLGGQVVRAPIASETNDSYLGAREPYEALLRHYGIAAVPFAQQVEETAAFLAGARSGGMVN